MRFGRKQRFADIALEKEFDNLSSFINRLTVIVEENIKNVAEALTKLDVTDVTTDIPLPMPANNGYVEIGLDKVAVKTSSNSLQVINEISFTKTDTSKELLYVADNRKLLQIILDVNIAFTRGTTFEIKRGTDVLLKTTETMPHIVGVTPKFFNILLESGDIIALTIAGSPVAGEGNILIISTYL